MKVSEIFSNGGHRGGDRRDDCHGGGYGYRSYGGGYRHHDYYRSYYHYRDYDRGYRHHRELLDISIL